MCLISLRLRQSAVSELSPNNFQLSFLCCQHSHSHTLRWIRLEFLSDYNVDDKIESEKTAPPAQPANPLHVRLVLLRQGKYLSLLKLKHANSITAALHCHIVIWWWRRQEILLVAHSLSTRIRNSRQPQKHKRTRELAKMKSSYNR